MSTTARATIKRHPNEIRRLISARQETLTHFRNLAADFAAIDIRPFYWHDGKITYTRELNIPKDLLDMIRNEEDEIAALELELYG